MKPEQLTLFPVVPVSRPSPLAMAVRALCTGGWLFGALPVAEGGPLPVPADVLVAAGRVLPPSVTGNTMTINQLSEKATLDWKSFNIGRENTVRFQQPSSSSVALNRIHQDDPSQIYGALTANGQVYLVNQNGFVFGKDSQVNVNSLVATTLNISQEAFKLGLSQVFDQTKLPALSAVDANGQPVQQLYLKDADGKPVLDQTGQKVKIQIFVDKGASIKTNNRDGRIILAAPSVTNAGTIEAADGQVILAASQDKVYLQQADADSDIRGLVVEVGTGGSVNNVGKILAERGNASLIGFAVNQSGMVSASTSVKLNGSVRLMAREGIQDPLATEGKLKGAATVRSTDRGDGLGKKAKVTLGSGSLTSVELAADKTETAVDAQAQARSKIEIAAKQVHLQSGSTVRAKSGQVQVKAQDDPKNPAIRGDSRIYVDSGATIDVSGVKDVPVPMEKNVVKVELRSNEFRDSPLQRNGFLHGKTVSIDRRKVGSDGRIPLADVSGALDRISRNIDERSTAGGSISLESSGDVITRQGSRLDFSGGSVAYDSGNVETTLLVSNRQVYDIHEADPNRIYDGIFGEFVKDSPKWGQSQTWKLSGVTLKRYETGYIEGGAGGSLDIAAFEAELDGILNGATVNGPQQRTVDRQAAGSRFSLDLNRDSLLGKQDVIFGHGAATSIGIDEAFPTLEVDGEDQSAPLHIDPGLFSQSGISHATLKTNGTVHINAGARVELPENGSLTMASGGFEVDGSLIARSGDISLKPATFSVDGKPEALASAITLGKTAEILTGGEWVNDIYDNGSTSGIALDGGHVSLITEQGDLTLKKGSRIDASGGAWMQRDGTLKEGRGGSIELKAATQLIGEEPSSLILDGELSAWGLGEGGSLSLTSNQAIIGRNRYTPDPKQPDLVPLVLTPEFFQEGGFANWIIGSNFGSVSVGDGVKLRPLQRNRDLASNASTLASSDSILGISKEVTKPDTERGAAHLTLSLAQTLGQDQNSRVSIGKNASIETDPEGSISLISDTSIWVDGTLNAPAGDLNLKVTTPTKVDTGYSASQGIWLGDNAKLLTTGVFKPAYDGTGLLTGEVLSGGTVNLTANRGYIITDRNSLIDVSGTAASLQFREPVSNGPGVDIVSRKIPSAGGHIGLTAGEGIIADGRFRATGGDPSVGGGSLAVEINTFLRSKPAEPVPGGAFPDDGNTAAPRSIVVSAGSGYFAPGKLAFGDDLDAETYSGKALLSADRIGDGKFGEIALKSDAFVNTDYVGRIEFRGDVKLKADREISLDTPTLAWSKLTSADIGKVELNAARVALGSTQSRIDQRQTSGDYTSTLAPDPVTGKGTLTASGEGIDLVGGLSFSGFGQVGLNSKGDIRAIGIRTTTDTKNYLGEMKIDGDLTMTASQFYPTTLTDYSISAAGKDSTIMLAGNGRKPDDIFSAGGNLSLNAANIRQGGVLRAPFGSLELNATNDLQLAAGSLTSVSGDGMIVPFGRGSGGLYWLYALDAKGLNNRVIGMPPEKRISLNGERVDLAQGAKVDISGGGDLYGYEFITGPGGSRDVLDLTDPANSTKFAVIPGVYGISTPYDPAEFPAAKLKMGDSVYLGAAAGLSEGWYTLLPAHYALLPGAYLVTPEAGTRDLTAGYSYTRLDGSTVVAGRYGVAGTSQVDPRWQGFAVEPGEIARLRSQFQDYSANAFFAAQAAKNETAAPKLPQDAGTLALSAGTSLSLAADLVATASGKGSGGQVDINAANLAIVSRREDIIGLDKGTVGLLDDELNRLNVESLLLGGLRTQETTGQHLQVVSDSVTVAGNARLRGREILLAAQDQVSLESGSVVESTGKVESGARDLKVSNRVGAEETANSDGALVRVSALGQINVTRDQPVTGSGGVLSIESGALLRSGNSMLLDSTRDTRFAGKIDMNGGSLALKSSMISIGDAPTESPGLVLANVNFNVDDLRLASASDLNLYGGVKIATKQLSIDAAAINGFNNGGETASIAADDILITNRGGQSQSSGDGSGELKFDARTVRLGQGQYAINGFQTVNISATEALLGKAGKDGGSGRLSIAGDLNVSAGFVGGNAGATTEIEAAGHQVVFEGKPASAQATVAPGLGVSWSILADTISSTARFELPSGALSLTALKGDVQLGSGGVINVSGQGQTFGLLTRYTPAGTIQLESRQGDVVLAAGAELNLAGAVPEGEDDRQTSHAGALTIKTPNGVFDWGGNITAKAAAGSEQGRFALDAKQIGQGGLTAVNGKLAEAGFNQSVAIRQREGDLSLDAGQTLKAHDLKLAADDGQVFLTGTLDASGVKGGQVSVSGSRGIVLGENGRIDARATGSGEKGGQVTLDTVATGAQSSGSGLLDLSATSSTINVSGGSGGEGGSVHLRTGRNDETGDIAITDINTQIGGSARSVLEATRVYNGVASIDEGAIAQYQLDTQAFMQIAKAPVDNSGAGVLLAPGLDIRSDGNLDLLGQWDFMAKDAGTGNPLWRWNDVPGYLTLNAAGDLNIKATLTDGFATSELPDPLFGTLKGIHFQDALQPGYSWSYTLAAGQDVRLANAFTGPDPLNAGGTADRQVMVRTGTGFIDIKAGKSIVFQGNPSNPKSAAAVYTIGRPAKYTFDDLLQGKIEGLTPLRPDEDLAAYLQRQDPALLADVLRWGTYGAYHTGYGFLAEYPTHGGDIHLIAGGDITGLQTGQMMSDWLVRSGTWNNNPADPNQRPTAWGINVSGTSAESITVGVDANGQQFFVNEKDRRFFNQNVGALGGGNVSVTAGGNITDLSVMMPTSGKPMGVVTTPRSGGKPNLNVPDGATDTQWIANGTELAGGGNLTVTAGGDIRGGDYYTGRGTGQLNAGGSITVSGNKLGAVIGLGDTDFTLSARRDVVLGSAMNPTLLPQQNLPDTATRKNAFFFTYSPESRLDLQATSGNVVLQNNLDALKRARGYTAQDGTGFELAVYPGSLRAFAPSGDIRIDNSLNLYPSSRGQLELLAGRNIGTNRTLAGTIKVNMSDTDPALLPQVARPETGLLGDLPRKDIKTRERLDPESPLASAIHATTPVHQGDGDKVLIHARDGGIAFTDQVLMKLFLPKSVNVQAGQDIRNLSVYAQNLAANDISRIQAGRDLVFDSRLDANGGVVPMDQRLQVDGPGRLQVLAGRNINLGSSTGILTVGNLFNRALSADGGASIDLLAGLSDQVDYARFIDRYLSVGGTYLNRIEVPDSKGEDSSAGFSPDQKLAYIKALPDEAKLAIVQDVLFQEISASAADAAAAPESKRGQFYQRGFDAISTLFPGKDYQGDIALVFSQIKTLAGGDINIDTPGGKVDVGLAGKVGGISKGADELGIVAQQQGLVNSFSVGNFNVNQSRVFTMGGGNIAIWSSLGDIDAGKGAKSAISAPPPVTGVDENGNIVTIFPPIVSGSGIQAITPADSAAAQGNVYLAAPKGIVNAGEAGISGGQVVIAANAVVGASNIQASGGTVGVPTAVAPPVVSPGVSGAAAGAAKAATQSGGLDDGAKSQDSAAQQAAAASAAEAAANEAQANLANNTVLNAEVIGYGECSVQDVLAAKAGCGS